MAKKKPIKKRRKSSRPTQKQSQKQIVNINFADKKKRRKSTGGKKNNLQLAVQSLSSNLNMFSSDTQRLNNLENLIGELRKEQRQLITLGRPTPTAISTATSSIDTQTEPIIKLKKTKKTQTISPEIAFAGINLEPPEPIKLKLKTKVSIPKKKRKPYETKGKKADIFYKEGLMRKAMEGFRLTDTQEDDDLLTAQLQQPLSETRTTAEEEPYLVYYGGGTQGTPVKQLSKQQEEMNILREKQMEKEFIAREKQEEKEAIDRMAIKQKFFGAEEM